MLNLETWSSVLSAADRERLRAHLPAAETPAAQDAAAQALLTREPLSLDTPPLELFVRKLEAGDLSLAGQEREQQKEVSRRKAHVLLLREHHNACEPLALAPPTRHPSLSHAQRLSPLPVATVPPR